MPSKKRKLEDIEIQANKRNEDEEEGDEHEKKVVEDEDEEEEEILFFKEEIISESCHEARKAEYNFDYKKAIQLYEKDIEDHPLSVLPVISLALLKREYASSVSDLKEVEELFIQVYSMRYVLLNDIFE